MVNALETLIETMTLRQLAERTGRSVGDLVEWALGAKGRGEASSPAVVAAPAKPKNGASKPATAGRRSKVETRTPAGRRAYDDAVLSAVSSANTPMSAKAVRAAVGGTAEQARTSLNRLIERGTIAYEGRAVATKYFAA